MQHSIKGIKTQNREALGARNLKEVNNIVKNHQAKIKKGKES